MGDCKCRLDRKRQVMMSMSRISSKECSFLASNLPFLYLSSCSIYFYLK